MAANSIGSIPLFQDLESGLLEQIQRISAVKTYSKNQTIFSEGENPGGFFIVLSGRIKIYKISSEGKEQILHIFGPGEPFGEVAVFENRPFPAYATALEKTKTLYIMKGEFIRLIARNPKFTLKILAVLSRRLHYFTELVEDLSLKEIPARLARYLLALSRRQKDADRIRLDVSKSQLASILGTIPETLSRVFAKMSKLKLIQIKGSEIKIVDREGLEELSWSGRQLL